MAGPPGELDAIFRQLPLRVGLYIPDDLLDDWFGGQGPAADYAARMQCEFNYDPERREGVFWKWVPAM
jgi:hypothetical protein